MSQLWYVVHTKARQETLAAGLLEQHLAARVLLPHIVASMDELIEHHTAWDVLAQHTQLFVAFGGVPVKNDCVCRVRA